MGELTSLQGGGAKVAATATTTTAYTTNKAQLVADSKDLYNQYFRIPIWVVLGTYFIVTALSTHSIAPISDSGLPQEERGGNITLKYSSRDAGLVMYLTEAFPRYLLEIHSWAALLLFAMAFLQKEIVRRMASTTKTKSSQASVDLYTAHKWMGYLILVLMGFMSGAGFLMGKYSAFEGFSVFSIGFAAPWVFWMVVIYWTATRTKTGRMRNIRLHRHFGNMMVRGCISVPLSRMTGSLLQNIFNWPVEKGFYVGIGTAAMIIGIWEVYEITLLLKAGESQFPKTKTS